ncbi:MAG: hypothetical protein RL153_2694 [Verrucomicrobiota bacterium]
MIPAGAWRRGCDRAAKAIWCAMSVGSAGMGMGLRESELRKGEGCLANPWEGWLPDMDLNHDKQIQSLLCYRYTIGQLVGA